MIYLGADHRGFELKEEVKEKLKGEGLEFEDLGNNQLDPDDDYVDFAASVAEKVSQDNKNRGILFCGSGVGVDIVANKFDGVRSALIDDPIRAREAREDDDVNVISLSADELDMNTAWHLIDIFLKTPFSGLDRHKRRLEKLEKVEENE